MREPQAAMPPDGVHGSRRGANPSCAEALATVRARRRGRVDGIPRPSRRPRLLRKQRAARHVRSRRSVRDLLCGIWDKGTKSARRNPRDGIEARHVHRVFQRRAAWRHTDQPSRTRMRVMHSLRAAHDLAALVIRWRLSGDEADALLGLSSGDAARIVAAELAIGEPSATTLVGLMALDRAMWCRFKSSRRCREWLRHPDDRIGGLSPLYVLIGRGDSRMLEGVLATWPSPPRVDHARS